MGNTVKNQQLLKYRMKVGEGRFKNNYYATSFVIPSHRNIC